MRVHRQILNVYGPVERGVCPAPVLTQIRPEYFLRIKFLVVALFQPVVKIRDLVEQVAVFERRRNNCLIAGYRVRDKLAVDPVISLWCPDCKAAKPGCSGVSEAALQAKIAQSQRKASALGEHKNLPYDDR